MSAATSTDAAAASATAAESAASIDAESTTTNVDQPAVRRQTSLGDYFPAELAANSNPLAPQQQPLAKRRQVQQMPPPRHRVTRADTVVAVSANRSHADDSGCCDAEIEDRQLRDCFAFTFTQFRQQQQPHCLSVSSTSAQAFADPFGLATLAAKVDAGDNNNVIDCPANGCHSGAGGSPSPSEASMSSSEPSSLLPTSPSGEDLLNDVLGSAALARRDFRRVGGGGGGVSFADDQEDDDQFLGGSSMFESSLFSIGSPTDRLLPQRYLDGTTATWRRRNSGGGDDRELFVGNLAPEVTNEDLVRVFSEFGPLKSVGIAKDSASGACKGFGFLCFQRPELAEAVLESPRLFTLYGRVLRVDWRLKSGQSNNGNKRLSPRQQHHCQHHQLLTEAVSPVAEPPAASLADDECRGGNASQYLDCQLFVGNLASDVTQGDLRQYFRRWGELLYCYVIRDEEGQSKRYGFITFKDPKVAEQLMQSRSSHVLKGKRLRFEMPKRSREEAFNLRQHDATTASATAPTTAADAAAVASTPIAAAVKPPLALSPQSFDTSAGFDNSDRLPVWLHLRLMADKEQLILCLRKELGLCGLLAERRVRELSQARDREAQVMRVYVQQLEARVKAQTAEVETLRHQLECRSEQVKLLTAKAEALAVEIVKAWGCAATAAAVAASSGSEETGASAAPVCPQQQHQLPPQQKQQQHLYHQHQHRLRPDSGIGL